MKKDWSYNPDTPGAFRESPVFYETKGRRKKNKKEKLTKAQIAYRRQSNKFFSSREWREVRYQALRNCGGRCMLCGASAKDGVKLHVDHIKPRSKYPRLALSLGNLQVLCADCNIGKGNVYEDDWR